MIARLEAPHDCTGLPAGPHDEPCPNCVIAWAVNRAGTAVQNLIFDFAHTFDRREQYEAIERLAILAQNTVVQEFVAGLRSHR